MRWIALSVLFVSGQAFAECYERLYTKEHLAEHPAQEVRSITFSQGYEYFDSGSKPTFELYIDLIRDNKRILARSRGSCEPGYDDLTVCKFENGSGELTYEQDFTDGTWENHAALIKLASGAEFEDVSLGADKSAKVIISDYDSSMKVRRDSEASLYGTRCESALSRAHHLVTPRLWNEVALHSVRNDLARPTVTARNLFHLSALLWDVHAAFDDKVKGYFIDRQFEASAQEKSALRKRAMAYASYHFLMERYRLAPANVGDIAPYGDFGDGIEDRYLELFYKRVMDKLGYPVDITPSMPGFAAAELGRSMAEELIQTQANDGSRERQNYAADPAYQLINPDILDISQSGVCLPSPDAGKMVDNFYKHRGGADNPPEFDITPYLGENIAEKINIDHWVRLNIPGSIDQGGNAQASEQSPLTVFWGHLPTFGQLGEHLSPTKPGVYFDPGEHLPRFSENPEAVIKANLQVIDYSALLSPVDVADHDFDGDGVKDKNPGTEMIDISPAGIGNSSLGTNAGTGHRVNPATGRPYPPNMVKAADYYRSIAEFWADGPESETPPGHWNTLANYVIDRMKEHNTPFKWLGNGPALNEYDYTLKLHLTLNGALHDAAVVAWGIKGHYQGNRPVMVIRKFAEMAEKDEEFANRLVSYSPNLKMVTYTKDEKQADGSVVKKDVRKLAVRAWRGPDHGDFFQTELGTIELRDLSFRSRNNKAKEEDQFYKEKGLAGVGWILADNWVPYQRQTFVTPPFPGFVSGHSTFSRAAAEVLTHATGSRFFPGGLGTYPAPRLHFEQPTDTPFNFQWATYYDAADTSGLSRIFGGIHASYDDLPARTVGSKVGVEAIERAKEFFR